MGRERAEGGEEVGGRFVCADRAVARGEERGAEVKGKEQKVFPRNIIPELHGVLHRGE